MTTTESTSVDLTSAPADAPAAVPSLTDDAASKVRALLDQEGRDDLRLRVAVQPGGCSGLQYQLFFDERSLDGDIELDLNGVPVVVDRMSAPVPRRRHDRLHRHDRAAGLHHRQPQRRRRLRLRQLLLRLALRLAELNRLGR